MNKKRVFYIIILSVCLVFTFYAFINYFDARQKVNENKKQLLEIDEMIENVSDFDSLSKKYETYRKDFNNNDIVGSIRVGKINTLLVQTDNNTYYLNHLLNRESSVMGSVFIDYRTILDSSWQINIYGHNSDIYDVPFKGLEDYIEEDYFNSNKDIVIETDNGIKKFKIFSVKVLNNDFSHTSVEFEDRNEFLDHVEQMRNDSLYDSLEKIDDDDQIIVLQTCLMDHTFGKYLIIMGKEI